MTNIFLDADMLYRLADKVHGLDNGEEPFQGYLKLVDSEINPNAVYHFWIEYDDIDGDGTYVHAVVAPSKEITLNIDGVPTPLVSV